MNKKTIIIITVLALGIGSFMAFPFFSSPSHESKVQMTTQDAAQYEELLNQYFKLQNALADDNLSSAQQVAESMYVGLGEKSSIRPLAQSIHHSDSLDTARAVFESLSKDIESLVLHYGSPAGMKIEKFYCPMVDKNRGASWLQNYDGTKNPYYGSSMLRCGSKKGVL
jgi:membrane fusion protein, copper/silver efflux system